jgi:hypothetical protein
VDIIQRQGDLIPLRVHALRVRTIVLVVNRHRISGGERSSADSSRTTTDHAIDQRMRIGRQRSHANADRRSEYHPANGTHADLGGVRMRPFIGPFPAALILRFERGEIGPRLREDGGQGILRRAGHGAHGDEDEQCGGADDVYVISPEIMAEEM